VFLQSQRERTNGLSMNGSAADYHLRVPSKWWVCDFVFVVSNFRSLLSLGLLLSLDTRRRRRRRRRRRSSCETLISSVLVHLCNIQDANDSEQCICYITMTMSGFIHTALLHL
jgi:hypothetical protein